MDKVIPFNKGIRRQPSLGEAGELSECVNLIPQNGELVNVRGMDKFADSNYELMTTHDINGTRWYISKNKRKTNTDVIYYDIYYRKEGTSQGTYDKVSLDYEPLRVVPIGSFLCVATEKGVFYLQLKGEKYINLGNTIPDISISLYTKYESGSTTSYYNFNASDILYDFQKQAPTLYKSIINKEGKKCFINPFFVRYAFRLYDGSIAECSPPVLMPCADKFSLVGDFDYITGTYNAQVVYRFFKHTLYAKLANDEGRAEDLLQFTDIVRSVCFYICPLQMCGGESATQLTSNEDPDTSIIRGFSLSSGKFESERLVKRTSTGTSWVCKSAAFHDEVRMASTFYLLKEVPLREFITKKEIVVNDPNDESLDLRDIREKELLNVDYVSDKVVGDVLFSYNNSLVQGNLKKWYYKPASAYDFFPYLPYNGDSIRMFIEIAEGDKTNVIEIKSNDYANAKNVDVNNIKYFFYPDDNARTLSLTYGLYARKYNLTKHPMMRGAYCYNNMGGLIFTTEGVFKDSEGEEFSVRANSVIQSKNGNPLYHSDATEVAVGSGIILGLSTPAKALSQGQFGQFPLYAFCSDGIWALEVADDGTFSAKQPVSRDVCNNPESITQIDGAVVFTTDQGLKLIQGSDVVLLSGHLEGHNVDEDKYFKKSEDGTGFFAKYGLEKFDKLINPETRDIRDIFKTCRIAYDYVNQLLRIFPKREAGKDGKIDKSIPYKYYVYSFTTNEFATVIGNEFDNGDGTYNEITTVVPDYPSSIVQIGSKLYRPMETESEGLQYGLILTRPLTLDEPFALKKLQDMRLNYSKFKGNSKCRVVLYVSNDGHKWEQINSFRGGAYKYFRIAVVTKLTDADALTGAVMRYDLERINKLR